MEQDTPKPVVSAKKEEVKKKPKPSTHDKNVRLNLGNLLADEDEVEGEVEVQPVAIEETKRELTIEEVKASLEAYGKLLSDEGKKSLPKLIESLQASLDNNQLLITVNSKQKEGQLEEERVRISEYFRKDLGQAVPIVIKIDKEATGPRNPYTDMEKLEDMIHKNPKVLALKDQLDLDIL